MGLFNPPCICFASSYLPHFICHSVMRTRQNKRTIPSLPLYLSLFLILIKLKPVLPTNLDKLCLGFRVTFLCILSTGNITEPSLTSSFLKGSTQPSQYKLFSVHFQFVLHAFRGDLVERRLHQSLLLTCVSFPYFPVSLYLRRSVLTISLSSLKPYPKLYIIEIPFLMFVT